MSELAVVVGGGVLLITTHTLDLTGMVALVLLCATWALLGSVMGALHLERSRDSSPSSHEQRLYAQHRAMTRGALSLPATDTFGRLSPTIAKEEGGISFALEESSIALGIYKAHPESLNTRAAFSHIHPMNVPARRLRRSRHGRYRGRRSTTTPFWHYP